MRVQVPLVLCRALPGLPGSGGHPHLQGAKERCLGVPDMTHGLLVLGTTAFALPVHAGNASEIFFTSMPGLPLLFIAELLLKKDINPAAFTLHFCMTALLQNCLCIN